MSLPIDPDLDRPDGAASGDLEVISAAAYWEASE
jgi:hypothetical protein